MRDYKIAFQGISQGVVADIDTNTLRKMIIYLDQGKPISGYEEENCSPEALRARLVLELEIRTLEGRL